MLFKTSRATDPTVELSYEMRYPNPPPTFEHNKVSQINPIKDILFSRKFTSLSRFIFPYIHRDQVNGCSMYNHHMTVPSIQNPTSDSPGDSSTGLVMVVVVVVW